MKSKQFAMHLVQYRRTYLMKILVQKNSLKKEIIVHTTSYLLCLINLAKLYAKITTLTCSERFSMIHATFNMYIVHRYSQIIDKSHTCNNMINVVYNVNHIITHPSKELCSKMAQREVGVSFL